MRVTTNTVSRVSGLAVLSDTVRRSHLSMRDHFQSGLLNDLCTLTTTIMPPNSNYVARSQTEVVCHIAIHQILLSSFNI